MTFSYDEHFKPTNMMDRWILSFTQSLVMFVKEEMKSESLVDQLSCYFGIFSVQVIHCGSSAGEIHRPVDKLVCTI